VLLRKQFHKKQKCTTKELGCLDPISHPTLNNAKEGDQKSKPYVLALKI
jgi:hypothetical protein